MNRWPRVGLSSKEAHRVNSEVKKAEAEMALARANLKVAKSKTWPDFKLGPTVETETLNRNTWHSVGGSFSLPLPLLSLNRGEKNYAKLDLTRASLNVEATQRKTALERAKQVARYQNGLKTLAQVRSVQNLNTQHQRIEALIEKGLIPSTLVIEVHRQMLDLVAEKNARELDTLDALWRIYIIDGRILNERI